MSELLGERPVPQRKPVLPALLADLVVHPGLQVGPRASVKLRRPGVGQRGVIAAELAHHQRQSEGPLGLLEAEVARELEGAELIDLRGAPPRAIERPEGAGDHAPLPSAGPQIRPQMLGLGRPGFAGGGRVQELEAKSQGDRVDGRRLDGLGRGGVVGRRARGQVGALHRAAADAAGVAVGGQPLGHPCPHIAGGLVLQLLAQLPLALLPLLELVHGNGQPLVHVVAAVAGLGGLRDARETEPGKTAAASLARPDSAGLPERAA